MDIVLIGSGNTATILGRKSQAVGHRILQVYSPNPDHGNKLATELACRSTSYISTIEKNADILIVAISDRAIKTFANNLGQAKSLVVHTAGALPLDAIKAVGESYGVLYPLQSLKKEIERVPPFPLLIDASNSESLQKLNVYSSTISDTVIKADDNLRLKYHLAATIVNNFSNYLYILAESFCEREQIQFEVLQFILQESVNRLRNVSPTVVQTGAAVRKDLETIDRHRNLLVNYPDILRFYDLFTEEIKKFSLESRS